MPYKPQDHSLQQKIIPPKIPFMLRLRNPNVNSMTFIGISSFPSSIHSSVLSWHRDTPSDSQIFKKQDSSWAVHPDLILKPEVVEDEAMP